MSKSSCCAISSRSSSARSPVRASNPRPCGPRGVARVLGRDVVDLSGEARHDPGLASTSRREALDLPAPARPTIHRGRNPTHDHPPRSRESDVGIPPHPRRTRPARHHHRRVDRVGDPQDGGHRPCSRPNGRVVDDVSARASRRDRRPRLLYRRYRHAAPLLRLVLHRTRDPPRAPRRITTNPTGAWTTQAARNFMMRYEPDDPVPDPRRRRPVHRRVRRNLPKRRHDDHPHTAVHARRERLRGTLGRHRAPRAPRPHPHLEPPATRDSSSRDYVEHYNTHRPHRTLDQRTPDNSVVVAYRLASRSDDTPRAADSSTSTATQPEPHRQRPTQPRNPPATPRPLPRPIYRHELPGTGPTHPNAFPAPTGPIQRPRHRITLGIDHLLNTPPPRGWS